MNNDEISVENLTFKQIVNCLSMIKKLKQENILKFDINTTEATLNYDEATRYLENQNVEQAKEIKRLNNIIDELERFLKYEIYCDFNKEMTKGYQDTLDKLKELKKGK